MRRAFGRKGLASSGTFRRSGQAARPTSLPAPGSRKGFRGHGAGRRGPSSVRPAVCQFVGYKNSGKTTLISELIPLLRARGCSVAFIKHDVHGFETDHPGTDTWKQREAGAGAVAITGKDQSFIYEARSRELAELIDGFAQYDYVLVEGFKEEPCPKIVLIRNEADLELLSRLRGVAAAAVWEDQRGPVAERLAAGQRQFGIDDTSELAEYLWRERSFFQNFNI
ncbi:molybdopterin-guanine dinucleotide biosynthesis protein B [Paenibacillus forsythiae]|uniref:Molybdopterin-guanine dinucleotide biosynthesis protein B n=1 Tax=Paenibacillus forsythiae TaxID=365616 RepID=A0ABU3H1P1_9BACL|nr:molybdopterin-guanine dinucleotide biosynthesis protein B [Paenibacillus forsythiae]MDT3424732.1 molybdopterin-guanine dinucleotide biosynthesis protein B [Paenibacillus forsythiae]